MLDKFYKLLDLLVNNGYTVNFFEEYMEGIIIENAIVGNENYYIDITTEDVFIEITVTIANKEEYETIEIKKYKNVKSAFNYIKKYIED
ncbi:MAG: hypothetical protein SOZ95_05250 [Bacilli bacterium]|nr:hypothetical protein [Bacilli bacterium]